MIGSFNGANGSECSSVSAFFNNIAGNTAFFGSIPNNFVLSPSSAALKLVNRTGRGAPAGAQVSPGGSGSGAIGYAKAIIGGIGRIVRYRFETVLSALIEELKPISVTICHGGPLLRTAIVKGSKEELLGFTHK